MSEQSNYPDANNNGVPDAFEYRRSISEILQDDEGPPTSFFPFFRNTINPLAQPPSDLVPTVVIEIETVKRPPKRGEMYFNDHDVRVHIQEYGSSLSEVIVRRIVDAPSYWKPI